MTGARTGNRYDFNRVLAAQTGQPAQGAGTADSSTATVTTADRPSPAIAMDRPHGFTRRPSSTLGSMLGTAPRAQTVPTIDTRLPESASRWAFAIESAATKAGIDPRLLAAVTWAESGFNADAVSSAGAIGLTQLMPGTAEGLGVDPTDPIQNLEGGARYLAWTIEEFGSIELGLAAYNAGPGSVRNAGGIPAIAETQAYVPKVLEYFRLLGGTP